jgi:hypothetical protein
MKNRNSSKARHRVALLAAGALGLTLIGSVAWAQADHEDGAADTANQTNSGAVVVRAPRSHPPVSIGIPLDKLAAFDAEAAQNDAWRTYRDSTPPLDTSTLDLAKDYPGLRTYLANPSDQPAVSP